ncbi:class II aldolase/adducin family protein [Fundidesulfovibrio terrae]|uniref:class II aldolase/adducin family protein n=1 Tax=Fundidesulfovibrio terrae TaxID=2922866 RepID=UPI001FAEEA72|nr:class II aldolase/adducin family protein [Fundidesulfovibrio terrae]
MIRLLAKYADKIAAARLSAPGAPLLAGLDDALVFNREAQESSVLAGVFDRMSINSLLFLPPAEPYATIIDFLAARSAEGGEASIAPSDCETRTFLHDLPVVAEFTPDALASALKRRKSVIVPGKGVVAHGTVSPEQAFVSASSVCFACFVKFFADYLAQLRCGKPDAEYQAAFERAKTFLPPMHHRAPDLPAGPFADREAVIQAMDLTGKATVGYGLVDSFFGNISYCLDDVLYISQTGSSLDELPDCIDPCHLDGSSCAGLTASSELMAHQGIVLKTGAKAILHGHPRFAVIMSMDCDKKGCDKIGRCHIECTEPRFVWDVPVVPGEVGTGPRGLVNTLPPAMIGRRGVIVYGHGLFAIGREDFREPFATLLEVENYCREEYFRRVEMLGS